MKIQRIAVSTLFFINGFVYANWASRLPELQDLLHMNHSALGNLLFILALGGIISMPFAGWLAQRFGSDTITKITGLMLAISASLIAVQTDLYVESLIFFVLGLANGAMDVAMNEQAVLVERAYPKPIMSSFHGFWSIGMAMGAGSGAIYGRFDVPLPYHFISIALIGLVAVVWASTHLIPTKNTDSGEQGASFVLPTRAIVPLGLIAFCCMLSEGTMIDWSAIYVNEVVGSSKAFSAFALGVFGAAMTIGRLLGDYFTQELGKKKLLILDAILAITGLSLVLLFPIESITLAGLFLIGLGLSTIVPIVYTTAGNSPGVSPSVGIAMATTIGYSGFFIGPPTIGFLADSYGLRVGWLFTLSLLIVMFFLILRHRFNR